MDPSQKNKLHLSSLSITGFRGIKDVRIRRLGRVTLLAGKNSSGKTTVLEAVHAFAARGREAVLSSLLRGREEFSTAVDADADERRVPKRVPDAVALFHRRRISLGSTIMIGPNNGGKALTIAIVLPDEEQAGLFDKLLLQDTSEYWMLQSAYGGGTRIMPWLVSRDSLEPHAVADIDRYSMYRRLRRTKDDDDLPQALECRLLDPSLTGNHELAELWDGVVLTDDEDRAVNAIRLVVGDTMERLALRAGHDHRRRVDQRSGLVAKLKGHRDPVPVKSLGNGVARLLGVSLSLSNIRNGFLLIDEAENGLHHSVHYDFWRMVLHLAEENNVQVVATTHSFSCVRGFAKAAVDSDSDGVLVRMERRDDETGAVTYAKDELQVASEQGIEVR